MHVAKKGKTKEKKEIEEKCSFASFSAWTESAKGCGLAIAYTSDATTVKPSDFVVFSTNHTCVWTRETQFQVPAGMPPCPPGGCVCSWNWIHGDQEMEGYGNELYMNGFLCNVTESTSTTPVATPQLPVECIGDESKCVKGAKQALFWQGAVLDGWNIADTGKMLPPVYNMDWGYA